MRKNHNLLSYVGFVDLVKAYNTANHDLLFNILKRYGTPPRFVLAIEHIYKDLVIVLKIVKEVMEIPQSVGVRQGNHMAPVLFLFLMSAFAETLESKWKNTILVFARSDRLLASNKRQAKDAYVAISQRNTCPPTSPQWKYSNACTLMTAPSFSHCAKTWPMDLPSYTNTLPDSASKCILATRGPHPKRSASSSPLPASSTPNSPSPSHTTQKDVMPTMNLPTAMMC